MATSLPGLFGNYWNTRHMWVVTPASSVFERGLRGEMYRVDERLRGESRIKREADIIELLACFLHAIPRHCARGESVDLLDFFHLSECQSSAFHYAQHEEQVFIRINADLFIPEFRAAESYWATVFFRTYHNAYPNPVVIEKWNRCFGSRLRIVEINGRKCLLSGEEEIRCDEWEEKLLRTVGPQMRDILAEARQAIAEVVQCLESRPGSLFSTHSAADNERRIQSVRRDVEVPLDKLVETFEEYTDPELCARLDSCPTLTMESVFDLG